MSQSPREPYSPDHQFSLEVRQTGRGCHIAAWVSVALAVIGLIIAVAGIWVTIALAKGWL